MKKICFAAALLVCTLLGGCASLAPLDIAQIRTDLMTYYEKQVYNLNDIEERLVLPDVPEILEQTIDSREKTAYLKCRARPMSENGLFAREDIWELWYTYDRRSECWTLEDKDYLGTEYELTSDLSQERCVELMSVPEGEEITLVSVTTDRASQTAAAIYTYDTVTAQYGEFGLLTMNAVVQADFAWQADGGWQYTDSVRTDDTKYSARLDCYIGDDGAGMLNADRFSIGFDLIVIGDMICIENLRYQGGTLTPGTLHIGKTYLTAADEGRAAVIGFSYVREVDEDQEDQHTISGEGSITITAGEDENYYAELFLGGFITGGSGEQTDLVRSGIPLAPVKGYEEPPVEEPVQEPEEPEEPEKPIVEEPKKNWIGTWVGCAPEEFGFNLTVTAVLREDGTCEVVCDLDLLGTIRRETDYRVVQNLSDLPTDLISQVMFGQTPTVSVVYDAEKDVLYTCLEEGMYVYLTREGSGEMGGLYEP